MQQIDAVSRVNNIAIGCIKSLVSRKRLLYNTIIILFLSMFKFLKLHNYIATVTS